MSYEIDSFQACESLLAKFAPLYMKVGETDERTLDKIVGEWKPPTSKRTIEKMRHMRLAGAPIGKIAKACGTTWRTAWKHSKIAR